VIVPLTRRERILVGTWLAAGIALWNGVYDMTLGVGIKEYLFRSALHEAGRGPRMTMATFWASLVVLLGLLTIRAMR
jgi:hypothetical protein